MDIDTVEYDAFVDDSCRFKDDVYPVLGLAGETGETVEFIKKMWRKHEMSWAENLEESERVHLLQELGDIAWYITGIAHRLGYSLGEVLDENVRKLTQRQLEGKK